MEKARVIKHFGSPRAVAEAIGIKHQAVYDWPDELPPRIADRVIAAVVLSGKLPEQWMLKRAAP